MDRVDIERFELNKTCVVCTQTKILDEFDKLTDSIEIPFKPNMRDWLDNYRDRYIEQFCRMFEENNLDKPPELIELIETKYRQKPDNIYDWENLNALFKWPIMPLHGIAWGQAFRFE